MHDEHKKIMEHLAIIVETMAFFLVTIDLYGKDRLHKLGNNIKGFKPSKAQDLIENSNFFVAFFALLPLLSVLFFAILTFIYKFNIVLSYIARLIIVVYILMIVVMSVYEETNINYRWLSKVYKFCRGIWELNLHSFELFKYLILCLVRMIIFIANMFSFEGIMTAIGATLFVISKVIAYNNV